MNNANKYPNEERYVILMNGYTACLKTCTARRIANLLGIPLIETNRLGRCASSDGRLDDKIRDIRYKIARNHAAVLIETGLPVIIDGTFIGVRLRHH